MGTPQSAVAQVADDHIFSFLEVERLEHRWNEGSNSLEWDAEGWIGDDYNKAWLKTEGEMVFDRRLESAEIQLLYSRLIAPPWDLQFGGRYDAKPDPTRAFAVVGIQGVAPYFFEVGAAAFLSDDGDVSDRFEAEYELLFTQRLVAEPSIEVNAAFHETRELDIGSGLTDVELGFRLRYEIVREFAPYVGVSWERKLGTTEDLARAAGEEVDNLAFWPASAFGFRQSPKTVSQPSA